MLTSLFNNPIEFVLSFVAIILAIAIHEFAHAYIADRLGDPTPSMQGRLTLDPRAHLDPVGTLLIVLAGFGWGKPVEFDPFNLRHPRRDAAVISIAGPVSNLLLATIAAVGLSTLKLLFIGPFGYILVAFLTKLIVINVTLAVFNLVPVHPLDGFKIVGGILPEHYAKQWYELQGYGMIFLIFLIFPFFGGVAPINRIILPVIQFLLRIFFPTTPLI